MPNVEFTQEDIASLSEMTAGWYPLSLMEISEGPGTKDPSSTTWTCKFQVIDGQYKGAQIEHWFSSKMKALFFRYVQCFVPGGKIESKSYPLETTIGKPIMGYIVWDMDRLKNTIKDFKPVGK